MFNWKNLETRLSGTVSRTAHVCDSLSGRNFDFRKNFNFWQNFRPLENLYKFSIIGKNFDTWQKISIIRIISSAIIKKCLISGKSLNFDQKTRD